MFDKLTKAQLLQLAIQYNLVTKLKAGYSKFKKPELINELKNHLTYNNEQSRFENISKSIHTIHLGPIKEKKEKLSAEEKLRQKEVMQGYRDAKKNKNKKI